MKKLLLVCLLVMGGTSAFAEFQSPSGNIICSDFADRGGGDEVVCYLRERDNRKPARPTPKDCVLDWGNMFALRARGQARLDCHGDYPFDDNRVKTLPYGSTIKGKGWQCTSQKTGMTCKNSQGRGFMLSRGKQVIF